MKNNKLYITLLALSIAISLSFNTNKATGQFNKQSKMPDVPNLSFDFDKEVSLGNLPTVRVVNNNDPNTPLGAKELLYDTEVDLHQAKKRGDTQAAATASDAIFKAQHKITKLFGEGAEGYINANYKGTTIRVPVDLDRGLVRFGKNGFYLQVTPAMLDPYHQSVMRGKTGLDQFREDEFRRVAEAHLVPIDHPKANAYRSHLFGRKQGQHQADPKIIITMVEFAGPHVTALNQRLANDMK